MRRIRSNISVRVPLFRLGNATVSETIRIGISPFVAVLVLLADWLWHRPRAKVAGMRARRRGW